MPAVSVAQRKLMAMALHRPDDIKKKNRGILKMAVKSLRDFASTREKGLPMRKSVGVATPSR